MTAPNEASASKIKKQFDSAGAINSLLKWVDFQVLPIIAWPILVGFAAVGVYTFLGGLRHDAKIALAIGIAAFVAFKAHK